MPLRLYFYCFCCVARFWKSLSTINNALLSKMNEADLRLAHKKWSWTCEDLSALSKIWSWCAHLCYYELFQFNMSGFEPLLCEQIIWEWRDWDQIHPHDVHVSSRVMRTYHTHFGMPLGTQKLAGGMIRNAQPNRHYLRQKIPNHLWRTLSRLRLSGHNLIVKRLRQQQHRVPYKLRICT